MTDAAAPSTQELGTVVSFAATGASIGGAFGGPAAPIAAGIGAIIGAVVGVGFAVGQRYLKKDPYEDYVAPEAERRRNPNADEGNPCPVAYGHFVRCPGQVIWLSKIVPDPITQTVPGKGKATQDIVIEHRYICNIAVAWCRNFSIGVKRIWANGEIIHDNSLQTDNTFNVTSVVTRTEFTGSITNEKEHYYVKFFIPLSEWDPTDKGWGNSKYFTITAGAGGIAANTGRMWIKRISTSGGSKVIEFHKCVENSHQDGTTSGCPQGGGVDQSSPGPYVYTFVGSGSSTSDSDTPNKKYMDSIDHHLGRRFPQGQAAEADFYFPVLIDGEPGGIGYTGTTYSEITRFNVTKWGSTIPRLEALVQVHDGPEDTDTVLRRIIQRGNSLKGIDVGLNGIEGEVRGYLILGPTSTLGAVQEFMSFYQLEAHEGYVVSGDDVLLPQLIFTHRDSSQVFFPTTLEVGAHAYGTEGIRDQEITVDDGRRTPNHLVLSFVDANKDFQVGSAEYINVASGNVAPRTTRMSTDLTMTDGLARGYAKRFLQLLQQNRDGFLATLPPDWIFLRPGDRIVWPASVLAENPNVRLTQITRGQDGVLEIAGTIDDSLVYSQEDDTWLPPAAPDIPGGPFILPFIYDIPPLAVDDAKRMGLYVGALSIPSEIDPEDTSYRDRQDLPDTKLTLWRSTNNGDSYTVLGSQDKVGVSGALTDNLLGDGVDYVWDTQNTITVTLHHDSMSLDSATRDDVAAGRANIALVGSEIIGFCLATSLGDNVYELSDLLRGLRDTSHFMATHKDNESFVPVTGDNLRFAELPLADFRRPQIIKAIPDAATLDDAADFDTYFQEPQAETLKPFTVRSRWVRRFVDLSYRVYFKRRTRVPFRVLSGLGTPRCETQNCYKMDVFWDDGPERVFIRTLCCCFGADGEYFIDYTKAEQFVDFFDSGLILTGNLPSFLEFELYQCSDTVGEGRRNIICVRGSGPYVQYEMCPPAS